MIKIDHSLFEHVVVLILVSISEIMRTHKENSSCGEKIRSVAALDLIKCLKQIK